MTELERLESIVKAVRHGKHAGTIANAYHEAAKAGIPLGTVNEAVKADRRDDITTPETTYSFPTPTHIW